MNWVMFGSVVASFPMMLVFKEHYNRLNVDQHTEVQSADTKNPSVQEREPLLSSESS